MSSTTIYKKMDKLVVAITDTNIYMVLPGVPVKQASKEKNELQLGILMSCQDITKEEFESQIPTDTPADALFKALYLIDSQS